MAIDSSIALGVKPIQLENPMNRMAAMYQLQGAQQTNQLNQMKLQEAQQAVIEANDTDHGDVQITLFSF